MRHLFANPAVLSDGQKEACRDALRKLAESNLTRILCKAFQTAHQDAGLRAVDFWVHLSEEQSVIPPNYTFVPLKKHTYPNNMPRDPYDSMDLQCCLKFLYFGGSRSADRQNPLPDTGYVLNYFSIPGTYGSDGHLTGNYADQLKDLIYIRNAVLAHEEANTVKSLTLNRLLEIRNVMKAVLEPFCQRQWSNQQEALSLLRRMDKDFYHALVPVRCDAEEIFKAACILPSDYPQAEQLLKLAGLEVQNGALMLPCNPVDFAKQLEHIFSMPHLPQEVRGTLLKSLLPQNIQTLIQTFAESNGEEDFSSYSEELLEELADNGNPEAQRELGWRYFDRGLYDQAINQYTSVAKTGDPESLDMLGYCYKYGLGRWDVAEAALCLKQAADRNYAYSCYELGDCYERGYGVTADAKKAFHYYCKSATGDYDKAQLAKARCLLYGIGTERDEEEGLFLCRKWMQRDKPAAYRLMGQYLTETAPTESKNCYEKAAEMGDGEAKFFLYLEREKKGADPAELEALLKDAAFADCPEAQYRWGKLRNSSSWLTEAAHWGHLQSCIEMGFRYKGASREESFFKQAQFFSVAMELGSQEAKIYLHSLYWSTIDGLRKTEDLCRSEGVDRILRAANARAEKEDKDLAFELAKFYLRGESPYYDLDEGIRCLILAERYVTAIRACLGAAGQHPERSAAYEEQILELLEHADPINPQTLSGFAETMETCGMARGRALVEKLLRQSAGATEI